MKIRDLTAFELAGMAGCGTPDSSESAGARLLAGVRDAVVEAAEAGRLGAESAEDAIDVAHGIADAAPDVYTHTRWQEFLDLCAYQEEPEIDGEWPANLTDAAAVALYQIARRLAEALLTELDDEDDEDEA